MGADITHEAGAAAESDGGYAGDDSAVEGERAWEGVEEVAEMILLGGQYLGGDVRVSTCCGISEELCILEAYRSWYRTDVYRYVGISPISYQGVRHVLLTGVD